MRIYTPVLWWCWLERIDRATTGACSAKPSRAAPAPESLPPAATRAAPDPTLISKAQYLAGVKADAGYGLPPQILNDATFKFDGTITDFAAQLPPEASGQMWNKAIICPKCSKQCAVTLTQCNNCDASLDGVPITATENILMGFVYGCKRSLKFDLKLSMRRETPDVLVYDDLLARSSVHMNSIPTDVHIPDFRWLLLQPAKGKALMQKLEQAAWDAVVNTVYAHQAWRDEVLRPGSITAVDELREHCIFALNAVPSQYQLHLHCIVLPLNPNDYHEMLKDNRFSKGRWLPYAYVLAACDALVKHGMGTLDHATDLEVVDVLARLDEPPYSLNYGKYFDDDLLRYETSHKKLENWTTHPSRFSIMATADASKPDGYALSALDAGAAVDTDVKALIANDKKFLTTYGSHPSGGKVGPTTYYTHAKGVGGVTTCEAWAASP